MQNNNIFITVDDDPINQFLSKVIITKNVNNAEVHPFSNVQEAIGFITDGSAHFHKIILLLDINMPLFDGWDFLDQFDCFDIELKKKFDIYLLSSSTDKADYNKAKFYPSVVDFIVKPLTINSLDIVFERLKAA
ncbi:response regulator [Roseivirga sp.]|uniref:response regulator n=1 Tax=Roseivirga sp. TaxID=1964215 RepID=UPI002B269141|nr:response regulator [Roseivirga sp.]